MPEIIDIPQIFRDIFGYASERAIKVEEQPQRLEQTDGGTAYYATDDYGREYWMPVTIGGVLLQNALVSIQAPIDIVQTRMVKLRGTVKEQMSEDDCRIRIKGICISDGMTYPEQEVRELVELRKGLVAYPIECPLTEFLGIENVVVENFTLIESKGFKAVQAFQFDLLSDFDFELIITE